MFKRSTKILMLSILLLVHVQAFSIESSTNSKDGSQKKDSSKINLSVNGQKRYIYNVADANRSEDWGSADDVFNDGYTFGEKRVE